VRGCCWWDLRSIILGIRSASEALVVVHALGFADFASRLNGVALCGAVSSKLWLISLIPIGKR
jgi:hypothetical protein